MDNISSSETFEMSTQDAKATKRKCVNRSKIMKSTYFVREEGEYNKIMRILEEDSSKYEFYFKMNKDEFDYIHNLIKSGTKNRNSKYRKAIGSKERLVISLRFLVTGHPLSNIGCEFRHPHTTVRKIVIEVCTSIWRRLTPIVMPLNSLQNWIDIANRYEELWKFPNCIGSIAAKSIIIHRPYNTTSSYYRYVEDNTIVVMIIIDADMKIVAIDVGSYGQNVDDSIFYRSDFGQILEDRARCTHRPLQENECSIPYVFIGDETFPLKEYLLRPYYPALTRSENIFNMRIKQARQVVVNVFDMLFARWKVFRKPTMLQFEFVKMIIHATCALHNFISLPVVVDSHPNEESLFDDLKPLIDNATENALEIREIFTNYFNFSPDITNPAITDQVQNI